MLKTAFLWGACLALCFGHPTASAANEEDPPKFGVGFSIELLIPSRLPEFQFSMPAFGPNVSIPVGNDDVRFQGLFGSGNGVTFYLLESGYYWQVKNPFFTGALGAGAHVMHYTQSTAHDYIGVNGSLGLKLNLSKTFRVNLDMKGYIQERPMLTFGGGFVFLL